MPFINNPDSSSNLTIFILPFISSLEVVRKAKSEECTPDPKIFLWVAVSATDAAAAIPNNIKTFLAKDLNTFPVKGTPVFNNGPKNLTDCLILFNYIFDKFIPVKELFAKALQNFGTWLLVNNNLCRKLFLSLESPATLDEIFKVTLVVFFIPDFSLLSCELHNFIFKMLYCVNLHWYCIQVK